MKGKNSPVKVNNRRIIVAKRLEEKLKDKTLTDKQVIRIKAELESLSKVITTHIVAVTRRTKKSRQTKITGYD